MTETASTTTFNPSADRAPRLQRRQAHLGDADRLPRGGAAALEHHHRGCRGDGRLACQRPLPPGHGRDHLRRRRLQRFGGADAGGLTPAPDRAPAGLASGAGPGPPRRDQARAATIPGRQPCLVARGEQGQRPAGREEDDRPVRHGVGRQRHQPGQRLPGVDRVQQQALAARRQQQCRATCRGRRAVSAPRPGRAPATARPTAAAGRRARRRRRRGPGRSQPDRRSRRRRPP